jgi:hypothetical protein
MSVVAAKMLDFGRIVLNFFSYFFRIKKNQELVLKPHIPKILNIFASAF